MEMEAREVVEMKGGAGPGGQTGPRTEEGKAAAARNALKHGLTAMKAENAVDPAVKAQYEMLRAEYFEEFRPEGAIEKTLMDLVVLAAWQLYKIREMETFARVDLGLPGKPGWSEKMARYRGTNERLLFRSLNQLRAIQQARAEMRVERTAAMPERVAPGVRVKALAARAEKLAKRPKVAAAGSGAGPGGQAAGLAAAGPGAALRRALVMRRERQGKRR